MREYDDVTLKRLQSMELEIFSDFKKTCERYDLTYFGLAGTGIGALRHKGFIPWDDDIDVALPRKDFEILLQKIVDEYPDKYEVLNTKNNENYPLMTTRLTLKGTKFREYAVKDIDCNFGIFLDLYPFDNLADNEKDLKKQATTAWFWSKILILRSIPHPVLAFKGFKANVAQFICLMVHFALRLFCIKKSWIYKKCLNACTRFNSVETNRIGFLCDTNPYSNMFDKKDLYPLRVLKFENTTMNFPNQLEKHLEFLFGDFMTIPPEENRKNHYPYELDFGDKND